ncbi:hypothetical protein NQ314_020063 [Rhamnusium bicolor]|uniref:DDE Tnp4 domain-containing protein n=1 Tax=Rhamnusium bicolor TaxID=1586634 RepID=A0AAV8WLW2_9CUCU|nr:hypothetical protein NQ314_020063 [Rhamnusium bicolor]
MSDSSTSSESASSDEEQILLNDYEHEVPKNRNYVENTVVLYSEQEFISHFRISRNVYNDLVEKFRNSDYFSEEGNGPDGNIGAAHSVLIFLWFAAHQTASFRDVADRFDITISSLFRITNKVIRFLSSMSADVIKWPNEEEQERIEEYFLEKGFPGVIGAIDGTHIKIDKPSDDPDSYLNRKHFFSIQVQVVCDHEKRIRDVFLGYPGSVHDSRAFRASPLSTTLAEKCGPINDIFEYEVIGNDENIPDIVEPQGIGEDQADDRDGVIMRDNVARMLFQRR